MRTQRKIRARKEPAANLTHIWYWLESNQDHIGGRQSTLTTATSLLLQRLLYELVYGNLIILNELQLYLEISLSWVSCCYLSWLNWNLECWFLWREKKPEILEKNPVSRARTNKKLNPHIPHQWQASALKITAPPPMALCDSMCQEKGTLKLCSLYTSVDASDVTELVRSKPGLASFFIFARSLGWKTNWLNNGVELSTPSQDTGQRTNPISCHTWH